MARKSATSENDEAPVRLSATTDLFEVDAFPTKSAGGGHRGLAAAEQIAVAQENPGRIWCVRQYGATAGGQASSYAASVRKHYPEAEAKSRKLDDGRFGVFVRFPETVDA